MMPKWNQNGCDNGAKMDQTSIKKTFAPRTRRCEETSRFEVQMLIEILTSRILKKHTKHLFYCKKMRIRLFVSKGRRTKQNTTNDTNIYQKTFHFRSNKVHERHAKKVVEKTPTNDPNMEPKRRQKSTKNARKTKQKRYRKTTSNI